MHEAEALWHTSKENSEIRNTPLSDDGDCLVKSLFSLVSTGTERLVANGQVPPPLYESMRVPFMEGSFGFPVKYGYSLVGEVVEGAESLVGKHVHLLHPHQNYCRVQADALTVLPEEVSPARGVLLSNMETALNAIWDSEVSIGDRVLLVGFGIIGSLTARLLRGIAGVELWVFDKNPGRIQAAQEMGFQTVDRLRYDFDLAFHCSSSSNGLQACIDHVAFEGKIIELSWYGESSVNLKLGSTFHQERKQVISSQVSTLPPSRRARWDFERRKVLGIDLLKDKAFDDHLGEIVPFAKTPELFRNLRQGSLSALSWVIEYDNH